MEPLVTVPPVPDLEPTSPEVKRYQRQKITAGLVNAVLSLAFLAVMALAVGPHLDAWLRDWLGENPWLRLLVVAAVVGVGLELLTLPLSFWSSFVLEHRYQLSNQSLGGWIKKQIKGYSSPD
jgi:STE24 endopeptidase